MALKLGKGGGGGLDSLSLPGKLAVGVLFVLMVGAAYFVVFYGEIESSIGSQAQVLQVKQAELETAKEDDRAYNKDLTELERRKQLAMRQKKILPDDAETPSFLSTLQTVATISGIKIDETAAQQQQTKVAAQVVENPQGEDSIDVRVECLATAFRALRMGEAGGDGSKRRGRKGGQ